MSLIWDLPLFRQSFCQPLALPRHPRARKLLPTTASALPRLAVRLCPWKLGPAHMHHNRWRRVQFALSRTHLHRSTRIAKRAGRGLRELKACPSQTKPSSERVVLTRIILGRSIRYVCRHSECLGQTLSEGSLLNMFGHPFELVSP